MAERKQSGDLRVTVTDWVVDNGARDEPIRSGRRRLYSEADIEHVQRIRRLVDDLGINLAGAAAVMHLRQQVIALQRELDDLRQQFGA